MSTPPKYAPPFEAQFDNDRADEFVIFRMLGAMHTATLVEVLAVRPTSGTVGFVDVQPLVLDTDTNGIVIAQSPIFNVPYFRVQGGASAVICDPAINDTGIVFFAERDITNVKKTQSAAAPPTQRRFSSADALYMGGVLNKDPTQWVKFLSNAAGIDVSTPGNVTIESTGNTTITVGGNASIIAAGTATVQAASAIVKAATIKLQNAGTALLSLLNSTFATWASTHTHSGVQTGTGTSGVPTTAPPAAGQTSVVQAE